jgi:hypothetical protein
MKNSRKGASLIGVLLIVAIFAIITLWILGAMVKLAWLLATSKIGLGILVVLLIIHIMTKDRPD